MAALFQKLADGTFKKHNLAGQRTVIGRATEANVVVQDEEVSRKHCEVVQIDRIFLVKDLGSRNGTYLNDKMVKSAELEDDYTIRIGGTVFVFKLDVGKGLATLMGEVVQESGKGKGYRTMMRELVKDAEAKAPKERKHY